MGIGNKEKLTDECSNFKGFYDVEGNVYLCKFCENIADMIAVDSRYDAIPRCLDCSCPNLNKKMKGREKK